MTDDSTTIYLGLSSLREVAGFHAAADDLRLWETPAREVAPTRPRRPG